jgi:hypothetical protein
MWLSRTGFVAHGLKTHRLRNKFGKSGPGSLGRGRPGQGPALLRFIWTIIQFNENWPRRAKCLAPGILERNPQKCERFCGKLRDKTIS